MEREKIIKIAFDKKVKQIDLFVEFFSRRFPNESNLVECYVREWCDRFNSRNPFRYMDTESKTIFKQIIDEQN